LQELSMAEVNQVNKDLVEVSGLGEEGLLAHLTSWCDKTNAEAFQTFKKNVELLAARFTRCLNAHHTEDGKGQPVIIDLVEGSVKVDTACCRCPQTSAVDYSNATDQSPCGWCWQVQSSVTAVWGNDVKPEFPAQWLVRAALHRHQQGLISPLKVSITKDGSARKVTIHVGCKGPCKAPNMQLQLMEKNGTATWAACATRGHEPHPAACRGQ